MQTRMRCAALTLTLAAVMLTLTAGCSTLGALGGKSVSLAPAELYPAGQQPPPEKPGASPEEPEATIAAEGWGQPTVVDEKRVRVVRSGERAIVYVEPWWGDGLRPNEGKYWLVRIEYKDTATRPVIFSAFGNVGRQAGRTELHRFGGLNDQQWKTAQIPLPWDMLAARPTTGKAEFELRSPDGDVPVASIRVVPLSKTGLAEAAERYNAETRDWVARAQAPRKEEPRNEFAEPQQPAPAAAQPGKPVIPFARNYLQPVFPYSAPQEDEINRPLEARMAVNEYEPAAFGVYASGQDLTNVRIRIAPLRHESGEATLAVEVRTAEYALVRNSSRRSSQTQYAIVPQRLWPAYPVNIGKGQSHWFWLTFHSVPETTPPGMYYGRAYIEADQGTAIQDVRVRVLPIHLLTMNEADLVMGGCVPGLASRHEMNEMMEHNHNQINLWLHGVAPTIIARGKDDFDLDFTLMDDFMEQMKAAGLRNNVYFLGGDPYGFPMTFTIQRTLATEMLGLTNDQYAEMLNRDKDNIPAEIVPLYRKWIEKYMAHARQRGWPEQILTPFDEPAKWVQEPGRRNSDDPRVAGTGPWIKTQFKQACELMHQAAPGLKIYGSIHHAEPGILFVEDIDVFCTNAIGEDAQLGDKVREAGKTFWQYSGLGNGLPDRARFTFGFFFNAFDSRGSLCWAYNWGPGFDTTESENSWMYAWATPLDVIPAPYYEAMREAWDDRRYVETLKAVAKQRNADIAPFLEQIAEQGRTLRGEGGRDTVTDFWEQAKRVEAMDELRAKVADRLLEITNDRGNLKVEAKRKTDLIRKLKDKI